MGSNPILSAKKGPAQKGGAFMKIKQSLFCFGYSEKYPRGRRGSPAKGVGAVMHAGVQITSSPPTTA